MEDLLQELHTSVANPLCQYFRIRLGTDFDAFRQCQPWGFPNYKDEEVRTSRQIYFGFAILKHLGLVDWSGMIFFWSFSAWWHEAFISPRCNVLHPRQHCQERKAGVARRAPKLVNGEERGLDTDRGDGKKNQKICEEDKKRGKVGIENLYFTSDIL